MATTPTGITYEGYRVENSESFFIFINGEPWAGPYLDMSYAENEMDCMIANSHDAKIPDFYEIISFTTTFSDPQHEQSYTVDPEKDDD